MISTMAVSSGLQAVSPVFFCSFSPAQKARMLRKIPKSGDEKYFFHDLSLLFISRMVRRMLQAVTAKVITVETTQTTRRGTRLLFKRSR